MLTNVLVMVADVMTTKLQMMMAHVYAMVVDVMTTQDVCVIWQMWKLTVFNAITSSQHVLYISCWDGQQNLIPYMPVINRYYDCDIAHPKVPCKICCSFFCSKELLDQHIASAYNTLVICYSFVTQQGGRCSCDYSVWYMVEQYN